MKNFFVTELGIAEVIGAPDTLCTEYHISNDVSQEPAIRVSFENIADAIKERKDGRYLQKMSASETESHLPCFRACVIGHGAWPWWDFASFDAALRWLFDRRGI